VCGAGSSAVYAGGSPESVAALLDDGIEPATIGTFADDIMTKQLILHIGTHKTGSKSLQRFMMDHAVDMSRHGIALYRGELRETNHIELHLAAMRDERDSIARLARKDLTIDAAYRRRVAERVQAFIRSREEKQIVLTSEGLSWLRYEGEIDRLKMLLDADRHETKVVLYLRNKEDFLRSYTAQIHKVPGRVPSRDSASTLYVEPDSWLVDYESLVAMYQRGFGAQNVVVIDYDHEMRNVGNVIPSFLRVLGLDAALDTSSYFLNTTNPSVQRKPPRGIKRWIQRAKQAWRPTKRRHAA
jgi:hypothetical protein